MGRLYSFCRNIFRKKRVDQDLDEEIRSYLELLVAEKVSHGATYEEALREARLETGGVEQVKESVRDIRIGGWIDTLLQDIRYSIRSLVKNPSFSVVAVATLALGIGATTGIFTVVNGVLLEPLPYPEPDRLVMLWESQLSDGTLGTVAPANFFDWHEQSRSFEKMAALDPYPDFILGGSGEAKRLAGAAVSHEFFSLLGVRMAVGRDFLKEEDRPGFNHVVILGYSAWRNYFGGSPDIVGKSLTLNNTGYTVVGVLPRNFSLVSKPSDLQSRNRFDIWTPLALPSPPEPWQRGTHPLSVFARLKPGVSLQQAQGDVNQVAANLQRLYPADDKERGIAITPLVQHVVADVRKALLTLLGAVVMLLLIACANVANLLLTRAATRRKEIAVRAALGASSMRIARQLITESLVLAIAGGLLGLIIVFVAVPALLHRLPTDLPRASEIAVDGRVLIFSTLLSILTGLVFGLAPLVQCWGVNPNDVLKQGGRAISSSHFRLRSLLVIGQVAITLVLLTGAVLMAKSMWKLLQVSPGFQTDHILTARLSLPPQYTNGNVFGTGRHPRISLFQRALLERAREIPGVKSAAFTAYLPLSGVDNSWAFDIEGRPPHPPGVNDITNYRPVSAGYFETMGIPVLRGRSFTPTDTENSPLVVIINSSMARIWWKQQDPIGSRVRFSGDKWRIIVGVVGDMHHVGLSAKPEPEIYVPYGQVSNVEARPVIVLRTSVEPASVVNALRTAVSQVDGAVPVDQIETMTQIVYGSVGQSRFRTAVIVMFALLALFIASIGLYGVMSYSVSQRTREFGIRMALGASPGNILRVVLYEAAKLVIIGVSLGLAGAVLVTRLIANLLFEVPPFDPAALASAAILLGAIGLLASYVPAQRAAKADPMESLRYE